MVGAVKYRVFVQTDEGGELFSEGVDLMGAASHEEQAEHISLVWLQDFPEDVVMLVEENA